MPSLRGIEISLTTEPSNDRVPEFPHPEGSSARLIGSHGGSAKQESISTPKTGPTIAVYIPSVPGHSFAIKYKFNVIPPPPCKYVFFKLFLNGRAIASWGINPSTLPQQHGNVRKSLWAPGPSHNGQSGLECRNFVFLPGQEHRSAAEDGGLIEVQVFRAQGRTSRAPPLEEYHPQKNYGIACPSIGLMDQPQDAYHYCWHLIDRKDSPFATFRFHYRSWDSLEQLNLIPSREFEFVRSISTATLPVGRNRSTTMESTKGIPHQADHSQTTLVTDDGHSEDESIFEGGRTHGDRRDQSSYSLGSPPIVFPLSSRSPNLPQPSKALRDAYRDSYLQRPLPELPQQEEPSLVSRRLSSSSSSAASDCLSLTPSLKKIVDEGAFDDDDTIEIGVARTVTLSKPSQSSPGTPNKKNNTTKSETLADHSMSDYAASPASTGEYNSSKVLSPGRYLPTTGSSFELGLECFTLSPREDFTPAPLAAQAQTELAQKMSDTQQSQQGLPTFYRSEQDLSRVTRLKLSESEWMSRTPSPAEREHANAARRLWSPPPTNSARTGRFRDMLRKMSDESLEKDEFRTGMMGNWI
ncbi:hypothetical protein B0T20DRAFT_17471 [Sordaria brevicollis]|uniref:Uncharacterized protein n=1 Tax=Sordaria brevicollis TaxID=83679 RepID=A0AAE0PNI2_SORBR|nr:hypothetical protein B0T20DRAFT_17471 [Sordaria brevicollis]